MEKHHAPTHIITPAETVQWTHVHLYGVLTERGDEPAPDMDRAHEMAEIWERAMADGTAWENYENLYDGYVR